MFVIGIYKKKRFAAGMALFFICLAGLSQQSYFQQEVNYTMRVRLDDVHHSLHAYTSIWYINHSTESLPFIYFHLWPNAYRDNKTALARQLLLEKKTELFFSNRADRGFIDSLDFKVDHEAVNVEYDAVNPDICQLILKRPLLPGDSILITTPFYVKIPDARFSRLGHTGQAYYITQWYPKPAVFDKQGWHPMPYLDQGEFYSEFGSFDVSVTLPENYLLAATGDRVDADTEELFLNDKVGATKALIKSGAGRELETSIPVSSANYKTVRFRQTNVHDFAWFADKTFFVLKDQVELPDTRRKVDTWVFFTPANFNLWADAIQYVNRSLLFYSSALGDYPYQHVTAVDGNVMAGGGMEYPNITVIGNSAGKFDLEVTIAHEVGHNWLYGMLANNERDNPFLDEGINSFYEMRYVRTMYPHLKLTHYIGRDSTFGFLGLNKISAWKEKEMAFFYSLKQRSDQALNLRAPDYTTTNYGTVIYSKMPVVLDYLADYMGVERFDTAIRAYFENFRFRHPTQENLFATLARFGGPAIADFEKHLVNSTNHVDYKIKRIRPNKEGGYDITVKNKTGVPLPFNLCGFKNKKPLDCTWYDGFENTRVIHVASQDAEYFKLDGLDKMPDINRGNNRIRTRGLFKKCRPPRVNFLAKADNEERADINFIPVLGANYYDGGMAGLAIYNYGVYRKRVEYLLAPYFGFKSYSPAGFAQIDLHLFPSAMLQQITFGSKLKTFSYDEFNTSTLNRVNATNFKTLRFRYIKISPYIQAEFKKRKAVSTVNQHITLSANLMFIDSLLSTSQAIIEIASRGPRKKNTFSLVNQLKYEMANQRAIDPLAFEALVQQSNGMAKLSGRLKYQLTLTDKHFFDIQLFGGVFLSGNKAERGYYAFRPSGYSGGQDYLFEGNYLARQETEGLGNNQFMERDANLKTWTVLSLSPDWMASVNLKTPQLFILPVKLFADIMACDARALKDEKLLWDAGVNVTLWKDFIDLYIPLAYSGYIKNLLELNRIAFPERLRFTFNIHKFVPKNFIQNNFLY